MTSLVNDLGSGDVGALFLYNVNPLYDYPEAEKIAEGMKSVPLTVSFADRVDETAPAFLDWRFGEFDSTAEFSAAYVETGANAFDSSFEELR